MKIWVKNRVLILSIAFFLIACFVGYRVLSEQKPMDHQGVMEEISTDTEDASEMESQPPAKGDGINYTPDLPDEIQEQAALLEEIRTLLKEVPYTAFIDGHYKSQAYPYVTDEVGKQLADFLSGILLFNGRCDMGLRCKI